MASAGTRERTYSGLLGDAFGRFGIYLASLMAALAINEYCKQLWFNNLYRQGKGGEELETMGASGPAFAPRTNHPAKVYGYYMLIMVALVGGVIALTTWVDYETGGNN